MNNNNNIVYRGFEIYPTMAAQCQPYRGHDWTWCHTSYDGPEDDRCGLAANVDECKAAVDEWWEEREAELASRGYEP